MERLFQDVKFGVRLLWKDRGFAITAVLTLAICIGANAAIFAVVNSVLLQPLPVPEADRFVLMYNSYPAAGADFGSTGVPDYFDRLRETDVFEGQALFNTRGITIGQEGNPQRLTGMIATPSLLPMLQVRPVRGRLFTEEDGELGKAHKAILTYSYWQEAFGGRDDAIGRDIRIGGEPYAIVGILPQDFSFLAQDVKLWTPLAFTAKEKSDESRHSNNWTMAAKLKHGATVKQAQAEIDALNARNLERFPALKQALINARFHTPVLPLQAYLVREMRDTLYLLWAGVLFVLLIGAVNITNLVMVRSTARMKELATRHALGAGLGRLTRQLMTETILLTIAGGAAGIVLGYWGLSLLSGFGLDKTPQGTDVRLDGVTVAFTCALALAVGLLVGLLPVLSVRHINLSQAFREEGRSGTAGRGSRAVRRILVTAQVAFAFVLLIGAGLLLASFERVLAVQPGFEPSHVLTGMVSAPSSRYKEDSQVLTFADRMLEKVRALPGVQAAGITTNLPFGGNYSDSVILAEGYVMAPGESLISPYQVEVTPGYLEAMGVPLKRGRLFAGGDTDKAPHVVIIDERLAKHFWAHQDPIGKRMWRPDSATELSTGPGAKSHFYTVVGIVGDVRVRGLAEKEPVGVYYFPFAQSVSRYMTLTVRASGDPAALAPSIRREITGLDPELPFYNVKPMQARLDQSLVSRRTPMLLAAMFGGVALFLAAIGIYGVLAYQVSQRRREIGIRMALGSDARRIFALVLREGVLLLAVGVAAGFAGAFGIRRFMEAQLFGVQPMDPLVFAAVFTLLCAVALLACAVPARRASRVDPLMALSEQ